MLAAKVINCASGFGGGNPGKVPDRAEMVEGIGVAHIDGETKNGRGVEKLDIYKEGWWTKKGEGNPGISSPMISEGWLNGIDSTCIALWGASGTSNTDWGDADSKDWAKIFPWLKLDSSSSPGVSFPGVVVPGRYPSWARWDRWCCALLPEYVNPLPHIWHWYGFSPVWTRWWVFTPSARRNLRPQTKHWWGLSPVWIRLWRRRLLFLENPRLHWGHLCFFVGGVHLWFCKFSHNLNFFWTFWTAMEFLPAVDSLMLD